MKKNNLLDSSPQNFEKDKLEHIKNSFAPLNYTITEKIGQGGMGEVYKAIQTNLNRTVAIKILPSNTSKEMLNRFVQEAKATAKVNSPNVVAVFDSGNIQNLYYMVMEFIEGKNLKDIINSNEVLSISECISLFIDICNGVNAIHSCNLVHRDLKPDNIFINKKGKCKIGDFGLVKDFNNSASLTQSSIMGTPFYMSPEQAKGVETDNRSDIYSLGIILFELLTSKVPFHSTSVFEIINMHLNNDIPSLLSLRADIPIEIEQIMEKLTAKEINERYKNISSLMIDITALADKCNIDLKNIDIAKKISSLEKRKISSNSDSIIRSCEKETSPIIISQKIRSLTKFNWKEIKKHIKNFLIKPVFLNFHDDILFLIEHFGEIAIKELKKYLKETNYEVFINAFNILNLLNIELSTDELKKLADNPNMKIKDKLLCCLCQKDNKILEDIISILPYCSYSKRISIYKFIINIGKTAITPILKIISNADINLKTELYIVIKALGYNESIKNIIPDIITFDKDISYLSADKLYESLILK